MYLSLHDLFLLERFRESLGGELRREGRGLPSPHPGFFSRRDFITHLVSNSNGGIAGLFVPVPVSPDPVFCQNDFDSPGLAGLHKRRHVHCGDVESGLRNDIAKLLVKGGLVATIFDPVRVPRPCVRGLDDLHAFLTHKGVVGTLDLPVHTEIPRGFAGHRVVVKDSDVCVRAASFAVVVDDNHGRAMGAHLFRQQEPEITGPPQVGSIIHIQFVGVERQHIGMSFHSSAVLLRQPVTELDELSDARSVAVEPRSQPVGAGGQMVLLLHSHAELQIVRTRTQVIDG